jgi:hypothetical protein
LIPLSLHPAISLIHSCHRVLPAPNRPPSPRVTCVSAAQTTGSRTAA